MQYLYVALILLVIGFTVYKILKNRGSYPSNRYTPMDDIDTGRVRDYSLEEKEKETEDK